MSAKIVCNMAGLTPTGAASLRLLEAFDGPSSFGQFYRDTITSYGVALQFAL